MDSEKSRQIEDIPGIFLAYFMIWPDTEQNNVSW